MEKFLSLLLILLFSLNANAIDKPELLVSYDKIKLSNKSFKCNLSVSAPSGWKFAKEPDISVLKSKNLKDFTYSSKKQMEKSDSTVYKTSFQITIDNVKDTENELTISIDSPICSNICAIASKNISIHFDGYSGVNTDRQNLLLIILFAIIGGLILNIMPCVLPVILMKLQSFTTSNNKTSILGSIAGNYVSFLTVAIFLTLLKSAGEIIGWGMHFQNANFLKVSVVMLFFFVLYSFGIMSISPSIQIKDESKQVFIKNFISSIIASIAAIPCTAPFLGTAATFAIQGSTVEMFIVFLAIATGFSTPYIFSLIFPITINRKLGKFSGIVKKIINCGVFIAFLWMFFLLCNHINTAAIILYCIAFVSCALLIKRDYNICAIILIATAFAIPNGKKINYFSENEKSLWKKHEDISIISDIVTGAVSNGKIVILNISADWCLTCKYNNINTLSNKQILQIIKDKNIICVEGDMTRKNDSLMKFINNHERVGIPFTIIYGPKSKDGILLSEIPSVNEVLNAIEKASL